jgi:hypothetical protein
MLQGIAEINAEPGVHLSSLGPSQWENRVLSGTGEGYAQKGDGGGLVRKGGFYTPSLR